MVGLPPRLESASDGARCRNQTASQAVGVRGRCTARDRHALETRKSERAQSTRKLPWIGRENPHRTPGKEKQASSVPTFGGSARPKKPVRRCFKLRPPWRAGFAGFASGCRLLSGSGVATWIAGSGGSTPTTIDPKTPGGCPAVDRIPTNRHAATGTCEIGQAGHNRPRPGGQDRIVPYPQNAIGRSRGVAAAPHRGISLRQAGSGGRAMAGPREPKSRQTRAAA